jgi:hypothetical protein
MVSVASPRTGKPSGPPWELSRQTIIEMESGFLLVTAAGSGTCLAVIAGPDADLGLVAYEMAVLVRRSSEHIRVGTRAPAVNGRD